MPIRKDGEAMIMHQKYSRYNRKQVLQFHEKHSTTHKRKMSSMPLNWRYPIRIHGIISNVKPWKNDFNLCSVVNSKLSKLPNETHLKRAQSMHTNSDPQMVISQALGCPHLSVVKEQVTPFWRRSVEQVCVPSWFLEQ